jgi:hypothetical protein
MKKHALTSLKLAFVAVVLWFLARKGFISLEATGRAFRRLDLIIPAVAALFITTLLCVVRWHWLLEAQGIRLGWKRTLQLVFVGNFFNIALPGAVSGDFVKAFYIAQEAHGKRARAFGSILFDRVAGLSALVLVAAGALSSDISHFEGTRLFTAIGVFIALAAAAVVAFFSYLFLVREHHDPLLRGFRALERRFKRAGSLTRIYEGLRHYHNHRWAVAKALALSVVVHLTVCWAYTQFAEALGDTGLPRLPIFVIVPLGLLVTAVPVAPAGVGTGHAAFSALFLFLGSQRGGDVFSLFVLTQLAIGALGGLVYLRYRGQRPAPRMEAYEPGGAAL